MALSGAGRFYGAPGIAELLQALGVLKGWKLRTREALRAFLDVRKRRTKTNQDSLCLVVTAGA